MMEDENDSLSSSLSSEETIIPIMNTMQSFSNSISDANTTTIYTIPGLNGTGGSPEYLHTIFNRESTNIIQLQTPKHKIDLGQQSCISTLTKSMASKNKNLIHIVHASSQGTATLTNYLCRNKDNFIKCIILEAVMASGNSAIYHTLTTRMKFLKCIPFGYYLFPYLVKLVRFQLYRPAGIQVIKSLNDDNKHCKLNKDLLIIIIHSTGDKQLSITDAYAIYYRLKQMGMKNVYMNVKRGDTSHSHLIRKREDANMLRIILDAHGYAKMNEIDKFNITTNEYYNKNPDKFKTILDIVNLWKPDDHNIFKVYYDNLIDSEKNHKYLEWYLIFMMMLLILYLIIGIFIPSSSSATAMMISNNIVAVETPLESI